MKTRPAAEAVRLEELWSGEFGDAYVERNRDAGEQRGEFWDQILAATQPRRILEVGCNVGANLRPIARRLAPHRVYGVDVNRKALAEVRHRLPGVNAVYSPARELPFRDRFFDLSFTAGVLIHQPEATLPRVMTELVRCSGRYVLSCEYHAATTTEISYRGEEGALFKRDYAALFQQLFPELRLVDQGFLARGQGWDDVTWWLFERR